MSKVGIIGCGVVGMALEKVLVFLDHEVLTFDKYKECSAKNIRDLFDTEVIFICLPTPDSHDGPNMSAFDEIMPQLSGYDGIVVIKSTVLPGTASNYKWIHNLKIVSNPEFLREKHAAYDSMINRIVIGGIKEEAQKVLKLFENLNVPKIIFNDNTTAEIVKYMCNCFLATKVVFANEFYKLCRSYGVDYDEMIKGVTSDPRIGESHSKINEIHGYDGHCFPKDMHAMSLANNFIKFIHEQNIINTKAKT